MGFFMDEIKTSLWDWYLQHGRRLPWRVSPCMVPPNDHAYRVLVSEIMLQQTTVSTVLGRFEPFLQRFPDVQTLADADLEEVHDAWAGLGYYRRATNLHACAQVVCTEFGGQFPTTAKQLRVLPGLGPYTSSALASICFGEDIMPVDGNIERIVARFYAIKTPLPKARKALSLHAQDFCAVGKTGHLAQALMDLASQVCKPLKTDCQSCPLRLGCKARDVDPLQLPVKAPKLPPKSMRWIFLLSYNERFVGVERRPKKGVMAGMLGFPVVMKLPDDAIYKGQVQHRLTHLDITADVFVRPQRTIAQVIPRQQDALQAMPTLMRKVGIRSGLFG